VAEKVWQEKCAKKGAKKMRQKNCGWKRRQKNVAEKLQAKKSVAAEKVRQKNRKKKCGRKIMTEESRQQNATRRKKVWFSYV
jgi:hypothetical protein